MKDSIKKLADGLLEADCIKFGEFTLKSGLKSPFYIDLRRIITDPMLLQRIGEAYLPLLKRLTFDRIAGLPYAYIVRQMQEYRSGARSTAVPNRGPTRLMIAAAQAVSDADIENAAAYFSSIEPEPRIRVVESPTVPQTFIVNWFFAASPDGGTEPLGQRIVEVPEDVEQFEARDPHARFVAYVPPGSISRGEALVKTGGGRTVPCAVCHGPNLEGTEEIPPITGRSPTYMVRQLFEFKAGVRRGAQAFQMVPTVANLSLDDMIDLAAYLATLDP